MKIRFFYIDVRIDYKEKFLTHHQQFISHINLYHINQGKIQFYLFFLFEQNARAQSPLKHSITQKKLQNYKVKN